MLLAGALVIGFASCSNDSSDSSTPAASTATTDASGSSTTTTTTTTTNTAAPATVNGVAMEHVLQHITELTKIIRFICMTVVKPLFMMQTYKKCYQHQTESVKPEHLQRQILIKTEQSKLHGHNTWLLIKHGKIPAKRRKTLL